MIYLLTRKEEIDAGDDEGIEQGKDWRKNHESMLLITKKKNLAYQYKFSTRYFEMQGQ